MSKHKNNSPRTTKEQLKQLSIATVAALGLISAAGAVAPPAETVSGQAKSEIEYQTSPLGYYFGVHRNSKLELYTEDVGQRIVDYANLHPESASLTGKDGSDSTGVLHVREGSHVVLVSSDRESGVYKLRSWGVVLRARDGLSYAEFQEKTNEKNDAGNTWDVSVSTRKSVSEKGDILENNLELAREHKIPLAQLEEADRRTMQEFDHILDEMGI